MNTYFVQKPKMTLAGVSIRTTNEVEMGPDGACHGCGKRIFRVILRGRWIRLSLSISMPCIQIMRVMRQELIPL